MPSCAWISSAPPAPWFDSCRLPAGRSGSPAAAREGGGVASLTWSHPRFALLTSRIEGTDDDGAQLRVKVGSGGGINAQFGQIGLWAT
jgi:hypothetical protein